MGPVSWEVFSRHNCWHFSKHRFWSVYLPCSCLDCTISFPTCAPMLHLFTQVAWKVNLERCSTGTLENAFLWTLQQIDACAQGIILQSSRKWCCFLVTALRQYCFCKDRGWEGLGPACRAYVTVKSGEMWGFQPINCGQDSPGTSTSLQGAPESKPGDLNRRISSLHRVENAHL